MSSQRDAAGSYGTSGENGVATEEERKKYVHDERPPGDQEDAGTCMTNRGETDVPAKKLKTPALPIVIRVV